MTNYNFPPILDNAPNYHNESLLAFIYGLKDKFPDLDIPRYIYNSAGDGKDVADTESALVKVALSKYLDRGNRIDSAADMAKAATL